MVGYRYDYQQRAVIRGCITPQMVFGYLQPRLEKSFIIDGFEQIPVTRNPVGSVMINGGEYVVTAMCNKKQPIPEYVKLNPHAQTDTIIYADSYGFNIIMHSKNNPEDKLMFQLIGQYQNFATWYKFRPNRNSTSRHDQFHDIEYTQFSLHTKATDMNWMTGIMMSMIEALGGGWFEQDMKTGKEPTWQKVCAKGESFRDMGGYDNPF